MGPSSQAAGVWNHQKNLRSAEHQRTMAGSERKRCGVQTLGDIFAMIAVATGAADKVIELMFRSPRMPPDGTLVLPSIQVW